MDWFDYFNVQWKNTHKDALLCHIASAIIFKQTVHFYTLLYVVSTIQKRNK